MPEFAIIDQNELADIYESAGGFQGQVQEEHRNDRTVIHSGVHPQHGSFTAIQPGEGAIVLMTGHQKAGEEKNAGA